MIVIATGFILLTPLSVVSTTVKWESSQSLGKNIVRSTGKKNSKESIDRCTGRRDVTEILFGVKHFTINQSNKLGIEAVCSVFFLFKRL